MKKIKEIIIVEGISDKQFLETFLDADILTCNGSAIDGFDIDFLRQLSENRGIIILTDPDYPGKRIRDILSNSFPNAKHAFVDKKKSIKHRKVGVAESTKEEVLKALDNNVSFDFFNPGNLTMMDLYDLNLVGENSKNNKEKICQVLHLGFCNAKTLLKRLNLLNVKKETIRRIINDK